MSPPSVFCKPAIASSNSLCPLPAIPAIPSISPERAVNDTLSSAFTPSRFTTVRSLTARRSTLSTGTERSILRSIFLPTIISVSSFSLVSAVLTVATCSPLRSTATLSDIAMTSLSLWVIIIKDLPSAFIARMTEKSFSVSCGVSTAVGSSRMRMSAPLYNTFIISTVCFSLTDMSYIFFLRSTSNPYLSDIA